MTINQKTVYVGISGGVDSSVAAALLKDQGYHVIGVFIRTWHPDWLPCTWRDERRDAIRVCAHLDIPFIELDLEEVYKKGVAEYMIEEYTRGRTPNPDVMCNKEVKFGAFLNWALEQGADYIATGHYAANREGYLMRGKDPAKDQSYFLWTLSQEQRKYILFPLGDMQKDEVRKKAKKYGLPTASKKDSQGICFLGQVDMKEFLAHYINPKKGEVHDREGRCIGEHHGALFSTLGERHGFTIHPQYKGSHDAPLYVVAKDVDANVLVVAPENSSVQKQDNRIHLSSVSDHDNRFKAGASFDAQIRYHGKLLKLVVQEASTEKQELLVSLPDLKEAVAPGQSLVIYDGNICLGGGIVNELFSDE